MSEFEEYTRLCPGLRNTPVNGPRREIDTVNGPRREIDTVNGPGWRQTPLMVRVGDKHRL